MNILLNLSAFYPEIILIFGACLLLLTDMFLKDAYRVVTYILSAVILLSVAACAVLNSYNLGTVYLFNKMFVGDSLAHMLKAVSSIVLLLTLVYSRQYAGREGLVNREQLGGEFYILALFSLLGQFVMISANNFLTIYLGLELMSLSLYALIALRRDSKVAIEAAMKYFILGALASGFLLYGISMLYGATGSLELAEVSKVIASGVVNKPILVFGLVFLVAGLAFKLGVVPFHMWVPDVYQGSPTPVTLLLGAAPKLATFAIVIRLLVEGLLPLAIDWQQMLMVVAVLSIAIGNVTALAQSNLKRMLAYSTIAQMGFMLLGVLSGVTSAGDAEGAISAYGASLFYVLTYVLTTLGTFGTILLLSRSGLEAEQIADLKGLNERSPWYALLMLFFMFSLAGVPPMVGFYAKLSVLQAVLANGQTWLAVFSVLFSLVGAFYYLRVVKVMYFEAASDATPIKANWDMRLCLSANGIAVLVLGILPGTLMSLCVSVLLNTFTS
jgi:NADH-quinone oxidoreductase subunit N